MDFARIPGNINSKGMKKLSRLLAVAVLVCFGLNQARAQVPAKADRDSKVTEVRDLVAGGRYTFVATKTLDRKGGSQALKPGYVVDISKDTVIAHLPGYDRVNSPATGDTLLTFTHFSYEVVPAKNGSRVVTILPPTGHASGIRQFKLAISDLGYTTLTVAGSKPVSCYGYIKPHSAEFPPVSARN
jgi:hypothetical protein